MQKKKFYKAPKEWAYPSYQELTRIEGTMANFIRNLLFPNSK